MIKQLRELQACKSMLVQDARAITDAAAAADKVNGRVSDPLAVWGSSLLECVLQRRKP